MIESTTNLCCGILAKPTDFTATLWYVCMQIHFIRDDQPKHVHLIWTLRVEQLQQRNGELFILSTFAEALKHSVDLKQTLNVALSTALEMFHLYTGGCGCLEEHR